MSKTLIIAEKPSVAADLARVLGKELGKMKKDNSTGSYSNDSLIVTSAVGHLVEQKKPQTPEGKSLPWKMECLPVLPETMELEPIAKSGDRLRAVMKLARDRGVKDLVNACDAGREGELIFRNIVRYGKLNKPIRRLWMQSMTDDSILEAWHALKTDKEMQNLADAAVCRSESDWLVGLNSTRALTVLQSGASGFNITPTGRVQTPTLAILAERQKQVLAFKPEEYHEVRATFKAKGGSYEGKWFNPDWKKDDKAPQNTRDRIWDAAQAQTVAERCRGREGTVLETRKPVSMPAPMLFDLTSLQREASNRFGFSARRTLQIAQECYEKHKVLTYPRTDSKYLPDDYLKVATRTVAQLGEKLPEFAPFAEQIIKERGIKPTKRVFDSSKVSDHFAIIPTGVVANLTGDVEKIYTLVVQRFLGVFMPNAEFEDTERTTLVVSPKAKDYFHTHGRVQLSAGWRALYGVDKKKKKDELCRLTPNETVKAAKVEDVTDTTKPPAAYTEATLLTAMETAGKLVDDEDLADAMKERGLGTPATRAAIIEGLISQEYIARDGKELVATRRGMDLIDLLGKIGVSTLSSPELTGDWEYRLKQMENGKLKRKDFMRDIRAYTTDIVESVRQFMKEGKNPDLQVTCPVCGTKGLNSRIDAVTCKNPDCKFRLRRVHAGLGLSDEQLATLITERELPVMEGFRSKFGKPFSAGLRLLQPKTAKGTWKAEFYFDDNEHTAEEPAGQTSRGKVEVKDRGRLELQETDKLWLVPDFKQEGGKLGFTMSKNILGKEISLDQVKQVLEHGKSGLIAGFVSQRTQRSFDAYLVLDEKRGNVGWEFPPREEKPKATRRAAAKREADSPAAKGSAPAPADAKRVGPIAVKGKGEHTLLETEDAWLVEGITYGKSRKPLTVKRQMCSVDITPEMVAQLLSKGKTELIKDFVSRKSGRTFEAYLVLDINTGRVNYEFPPRK